jgi:hypothetical protein
LITRWSEFPFKEISEKSLKTVVDLLTLAAAENLSTGSEFTGKFDNEVMNAFKSRIGTLLSSKSSSAEEVILYSILLHFENYNSVIKHKDDIIITNKLSIKLQMKDSLESV